MLDILFPLDVVPQSYVTKLVLRFYDSDTQLAVLLYPPYPIHPGGRAEIVRYSISGMSDSQVSQLISKMLSDNPDATDREIAAKLKVDISRSPVGYEMLNRFISELKTIRLSPILAGGVAVDEYSIYEFWYSDGQDSVSYRLTGPFHDAPQDRLVQWMIRFRASVPELLKAGSAR